MTVGAEGEGRKAQKAAGDLHEAVDLLDAVKQIGVELNRVNQTLPGLAREEAKKAAKRLKQYTVCLLVLTVLAAGVAVGGYFRTQWLCHRADDSKTVIREVLSLAQTLGPSDATPAEIEQGRLFIARAEALASPINCSSWGSYSLGSTLAVVAIVAAIIFAAVSLFSPEARSWTLKALRGPPRRVAQAVGRRSTPPPR